MPKWVYTDEQSGKDYTIEADTIEAADQQAHERIKKDRAQFSADIDLAAHNPLSTFVRGATAGLSDQAQAAGYAAGQYIRDLAHGRNTRFAKDYSRAKQEIDRGSDLGDALGTSIGAAMTAPLTGEATIGKALSYVPETTSYIKNLLSRTGRGAVANAAISGANADLTNPEDINRRAALGAGIGGALPIVGDVSKFAAQLVKRDVPALTPAQRGDLIAGKLLNNPDVNAGQQTEQQLSNIGVDGVPAAVTIPEAQYTVAGIAQKSRKGLESIRDRVNKSIEYLDRTSEGTIQQLFGTRDAKVSTNLKQVDEHMKEADQAYNDYWEKRPQVPIGDITKPVFDVMVRNKDFVKRTEATLKALPYAQSFVDDNPPTGWRARNPYKPYQGKLNLQAIVELKNLMAQASREQGANKTALRADVSKLRGWLSMVSPETLQQDEVWQALHRIRDVPKYAKAIISNDVDVSGAQINDIVDRLEQLTPEAAQDFRDHLRVAVGQNMLSRMKSNKDNVGAWLSSPQFRDKMALVLGPDEADKLVNNLGLIHQTRTRAKSMLPSESNLKTAEAHRVGDVIEQQVDPVLRAMAEQSGMSKAGLMLALKEHPSVLMGAAGVGTLAALATGGNPVATGIGVLSGAGAAKALSTARSQHAMAEKLGYPKAVNALLGSASDVGDLMENAANAQYRDAAYKALRRPDLNPLLAPTITNELAR